MAKRAKNLLNLPEYQQFVARYQNNLLLFFHEVLQRATSTDQTNLLNELDDPKARVSVVSGTGTGKTFTMGGASLHHLLCFPVAHYDNKFEIGSNTYIGAARIKQVQEGVWKEIYDAYATLQVHPCYYWLADYIDMRASYISIFGFKEQWFITSFAMQQGKSVAVAGKHRFHQLIIIDEAAGVADEHFDVINGTQTQGGNKTLLASQGVKQGGFFYETHHSLNKANGGAWTALCFSSENSPFVEDDWLKNVEVQSGGRDSVEYRVRVLGKFAENENENLLTRAQLEKCFEAQLDFPILEPDDAWGWLMLVDVGAGEYRDDSVCVLAKVVGHGDFGVDARRIEYHSIPICTNSKNLRDFRGLLLEEYAKLSNARILLDAGGAGLELYKMLQEDGVDVEKVNWGKPCFSQEYKERFFNQRACAMVRFRDAVKQGRVSFCNMDSMLREKFLMQGSRLPYRFTDTGTARYQMWGKDEMRAKGIASPDLIDAMSFAFLESAYYNVSESAFDETNQNHQLLNQVLSELSEEDF